MPAARSRSWSGGKDEILRVYDGWAPEVLRAVRETPEDAILSMPSCDRVFLEHWGDGPVTLLGDAAHPMLTSLGQGAAMAIEDAVVLADAMARHADDPRAGLRAYEDARRERTRAMVAQSRRTSDLEQLEHPVATALRNTFLRWAPKSALTRPLEAALTFPVPGAGSSTPETGPDL